MKIYYLKVIGSAVAVFGCFLPQAYACQGPQFETTYTYYSDQPVAEIPDGMIQIKVRFNKEQIVTLHGDGSRYPQSDYAKVQMITEDGTTRRIALKTPSGLTSCDNIRRPNVGDHYIIGTYAKEHGSQTLYFGGRPLFIHYQISATRGYIDLPSPNRDQKP